MNATVKKVFRHVVVTMLVFTQLQHTHAQSVHDSLLILTRYFFENTKDEQLRKALKEAQAWMANDSVTAPLAAKLVATENIITNSTTPTLDGKMVFAYADLLERLLRQLPRFNENPSYAGSLFNLATLYQQKRQLDKALEFCRQALAIQKKVLGEEHADYAGTLYSMAFVYNLKSMYETGLAPALQALDIRKKIFGTEHPEYADVLNLLGNLYSGMGQLKNALPFYQQALAIRKKTFGAESALYANTGFGLTVLYTRMGEYEKALPFGLEVTAIRKKLFGEENISYANSLESLAYLYSMMGDYEKALPLCRETLAIKKKVLGVEHPGYAGTLGNLALLYLQMGQYQNAVPLNQEVIAISKKLLGEEHPDYARKLHNLAELYHSLGEYDKALPLYLQSLAIIQKALGKEHPDYILGLVNTASLYQNLGDVQKALSLMEEALAIQKKNADLNNSLYVLSLNTMAGIYLEMADYQKSMLYTQQALDVMKKDHREEQREYANSLNNLADIYDYLEQYDKALPLYQQALSVWKKMLGDKHPDYIRTLNRLGLHYVVSGNVSKAPAILMNAYNIELEHLTRTYSTLTENEKVKLLDRESYQFSYLPSFMFTKGIVHAGLLQQLYTNELALKGMVLENQKQVLHDIRHSGDSSDLIVYKQWQFNKNYLGRQYLLPLNQRTEGLDSLEDATNQLEQQLSRRFTAFSTGMQSITQKDISRKLMKGQAAIEFIQFKLYDKRWTDSLLYAALILLPGDSNVHFVPLCEEKQLQKQLNPPSAKTNAYALIQKLYPGTAAAGHRPDSLYQLVWKPLEKYLQGVHTVFYAPAGLLHRIAFDALQAGDKHLLADKYKLNRLLSTRSIALPAQASGRVPSAGLWGDVQYTLAAHESSQGMDTAEHHPDTTAASFNFYTADSRGFRGGEWQTLAGTKKELDNIRAIMHKAGIQTTVASGAAATEEAFKQMDGKSPAVLHLATHGFFLRMPAAKSKNNNHPVADENAFTVQQNPMFRSGLVLAGGNYAWKGGTAIAGREDGILTAYEIAQLDLSNTSLVVLSACETALGDIEGNEGVIGLQRAFRMAGVKQLIVSLWRIPDKETAELMKLFYTNWLHGLSAREALHAAQMKMKQKYPPYYWASFVLVE